MPSASHSSAKDDQQQPDGQSQPTTTFLLETPQDGYNNKLIPIRTRSFRQWARRTFSLEAYANSTSPRYARSERAARDRDRSRSSSPTKMPMFEHPLNNNPHLRMRQTDDYLTARYPSPHTGLLSPSALSVATHRTPESLDSLLTLSSALPKRRAERSRWRCDDSGWWMEVSRSATSLSSNGSTEEPGIGRPDRRDSASTTSSSHKSKEPGQEDPLPQNDLPFESDRFAVVMPTTREPLPPLRQHQRPSHTHRRPSAGEIVAYRHYAAKVRRASAHEYGFKPIPPGAWIEDIRDFIPTAHVSPNINPHPPTIVELDATPPSSPPSSTPPKFNNTVRSPSLSSPCERAIVRKPVGQGPSHSHRQQQQRTASNRLVLQQVSTPPRQQHARTHKVTQRHPHPHTHRPTPHPSAETARAQPSPAAAARPRPHVPTDTLITLTRTSPAATPPHPILPASASNSAPHSLSHPSPRQTPPTLPALLKFAAKCILFLYLAVGVWCLLDAVRQAVWAMCWPGRVVWRVGVAVGGVGME